MTHTTMSPVSLLQTPCAYRKHKRATRNAVYYVYVACFFGPFGLVTLLSSHRIFKPLVRLLQHSALASSAQTSRWVETAVVATLEYRRRLSRT